MHRNTTARLIAVTAGLWLGTPVWAQSSQPTPPAQPAPPLQPVQQPAQQPAQPSAQQPQDDAAQAAFKGADTNKDGQLNREESAKLTVIAARFAELDKNKDGQLSWEEFRAGYRAAP